MSDCHAGAYIEAVEATNLFNFIYAHTNDGALNIRGMVWTGDIYEQAANWYSSPWDWTVEDMTNRVSQMVSNGLFFVASDGNHDADNFSGPDGWTWYNDAANSNTLAWNKVFPVEVFSRQTNFVSGLRYATNRVANDSRNLVMTYERDGIRLAFLTFSSAFTNGLSPYQADVKAQILPQTLWLSNQMASRPNWNSIVLAHFFLGCDVSNTNSPTFGVPVLSNQDFTSTAYSNIAAGSYVFEQGLGSNQNWFMGLSGHTRSLNKGHVQTNQTDLICFNWQTGGGVGDHQLVNGKIVSVITFYPRTRSYVVRSFLTETGTEVTNGSPSATRVFSGRTNLYEQTWTNRVPIW